MTNAQSKASAWLAYLRLREQLLALPGVVAVGTFFEREVRRTTSGRRVPTSHAGIVVTVRDLKSPAVDEANRLIGSSTGLRFEVETAPGMDLA